MRISLLLATAALALTSTGALAQGQPPFGGSQNAYLCHNINNARALGYIAAVREQFGDTEFEILEAIRICTPVLEGKFENPANGQTGQFRASQPEVHYICYRARIGNTNALGKDFAVENQLETQKYRSDQPVEFCVPTRKEEL